MITFSFADESVVGKKRHPKPIGYEDIVIPVGETIILTPANAKACLGALVRFEGGPFRCRMDGGNPVSASSILTSSGYQRNDGDEYFLSRTEAAYFNVLLDINGPLVATEGILRVTYYG